MKISEPTHVAESEEFIPSEETREERAEQYYQEIEAMADGAGRMREFLVEHPRPTAQEFEKNVLATTEPSERVRGKLQKAFSDYQEKAHAVDYNQKLYQNPREFFETTFGFPPKGRVDIVWHPLGAQLFLDGVDYEKTIQKSVSSLEVRPARAEGGFYDYNLGSGTMKGLVAVGLRPHAETVQGREKLAAKIYNHEMQHVINRNLFMSPEVLAKQSLRSLHQLTNQELFETKTYVSTFQTILGERWRDEVLAFYASHGKIPSVKECVGIDSQILIGDIQEQIFERYLHNINQKWASLINNPKHFKKMMEAVIENKQRDFYENLMSAAREAHVAKKKGLPTEQESKQLFKGMADWLKKHLGPVIEDLEQADKHFYEEVKKDKEPLIGKLITQFGQDKAFNLLSVMPYSKLHHLEKLIERRQGETV